MRCNGINTIRKRGTNLMNIEELKKEVKSGNRIYKGICHDCGKHVEVSVIVNEEGEIDISGGAVYKVNQEPEKLLFFKCDACFKNDKTLRDFRQCEVYSRVVGYLRPVNQWNKGKKAEYALRKDFKNVISQHGVCEAKK